MTRKEIEDIGITGVKVEFGLLELYILANLRNELETVRDILINVAELNEAIEYTPNAVAALSKSVNLLRKIIPVEIMPLNKLEDELFSEEKIINPTRAQIK